MVSPTADRPLSIAGPSRFFASPSVRSLIHPKDGGVLFNIDKGKCFSLNSVGAEIWKIVENNSKDGLDQASIIHSVSRIYEIPPERVMSDVARFLQELKIKGFIVPATEIKPGSAIRTVPISAGDFVGATPQPYPKTTGEDATTKPNRGPKAKLIFSYLAFLLLLAADIVLKTGGFPKLYSIVKRFRVRGRRYADESTVGAICASVDRATSWYLKPAWCLQRSAVTACLLRFYGIAGRLVLGCSKLPFRAHAWVEVNGVVVNDRPDIGELYKTIDLL